ncbi:cytosolic iron-sulfur assembly component 2A [Caerostris extrusa]|uniref:Cytosolic iron-sulfur assembly component 2A n=1 Tax=Caerostris extrusa TaxID=172846 RepID=A0AAV4YBC2_CAEEX|nr:cytosolic iron-sulfur assembly component 2A [Caerostris extrusa]
MDETEISDLRGEIYDVIKTIRDPEKPQTLEELAVINEEDISVKIDSKCSVVTIELTPTIPHCSLATILGLCVRTKLEKYWGKNIRHRESTLSLLHIAVLINNFYTACVFFAHLDVFLKEGTHASVHEVSKQLNDKERVAAAMENPELREKVEECIKEDDG